MFVADDLNHRVVRYSTRRPSYPYKARWGSYGTEPGQLAYPRGDRDRRAPATLYVANTGNDRIDVFDRSGSAAALVRHVGPRDRPVQHAARRRRRRRRHPRGDRLGQRPRPAARTPTARSPPSWGSPNPGPTILPNPVAVAFDAAGNAYVLDQRRARDRRLRPRDAACRCARSARQGSGPGQLLDPSALAIDARGHDLRRRHAATTAIARFTDRRHLPRRDHRRRAAAARHRRDARRQRASTSPTRNRITRLRRRTAASSTQFGGTRHQARQAQRARRQIALDPAGNLWVADRGNNRVQQFGPDGERLRDVRRARDRARRSSSTRPASASTATAR